QRVAERLSGGQARMALQLEEDLRQQVKGQRWHGRSSRHEQPGDASLRERAEAQLLRLYLHVPSLRATIRQELRQRELEDFGLPHHRKLWAHLSALEEDNLGVGLLENISRGSEPGDQLADLELPRLLSDLLLIEDSPLLQRLTALLEPGELQQLGLVNPSDQLRGTTASLERHRVLRRCRHLLEAWGSQRLQSLEQCIAMLLESKEDEGDAETRIEALFQRLNADALRFQELYYTERQYLQQLDQQRCRQSA
ncbi:MAG: DNA primase, partial [Synechococcus sp.]|nr:DNA primase [Synechococcus sp.]